MAQPRRDFLPADLKTEMEHSGFQGTIAVQARQTLQETQWLLDLADGSPFILGGVGWVDLRSPRVRSQLEIKEDVVFRRKWAERCGVGFELPSIVPSVPKCTEKTEVTIAA